MKRIIILLLLTSFIANYANGQGTIRGIVTDENGSALIGATVMLKTTPPIGAVTDYDGKYSIITNSSLPVVILVTYIGYHPIEDTVKLQKSEVLIKNFDMTVISNSIGEVTVVARASKAKESYMEKVKLNSSTFIDFISTETIKRTGDANVSAAVSRITGVSTFGGFITVRGIGDRYIKTTINGLRIPTLDPFTNNIKLDLFPASMVDNIIISKTASPDLPGDWSGAYLSIETKDYPEKLTLNIESSFGYNSQNTFKNLISSDRSTTDWLGFDNGLRNIQHQKSVYYNGTNSKYMEFAIGLDLKDYFNQIGIDENTIWDDSYTKLALIELGFLGKAQYNDNEAFIESLSLYNASDLKKQGILAATSDIIKMGQSLPNKWLTVSRKAPLDFSQSFSIGNQILLFNRPLGYLVGFRYSASTVYDDNARFGRSSLLTNQLTSTTLDPRIIYSTFGSGKNNAETNGWSALFNAALKLNPNNSISFLFMPNLIGVNKARMDMLSTNKSGSPISYYTIAQQYESRKQLVYQLKTDHYLPALKMKIEIDASFTGGKSNSPDYRQLLYEYDTTSQAIKRLYWERVDNGNFRVFRDLSEDLFDSHMIAEISLGENLNLPRKIKFGGTWQRVIRKSDQRYYYLPAPAIDQLIENNDIAAFLSLDNFSEIKANGNLKRYYFQLTSDQHNTIGFSETIAGFILTEYSITPEFRISGGVRVENVNLHTDIAYFYERRLPVNDDRRNIFDLSLPPIKPCIRNEFFILPSANLIYHFKQDKQTPVNVRFNFSQTMALPSLRELTPYEVFDYSLMGNVKGSVDLKPVYINNYDLRFESYFKSGNSISMSLFYKDFRNHIEMVRKYLVDEVNFSWQNTDNSRVTGLEIEGRLGITKNLEFRANATLVDSKTRLRNDTISRAMFGQAPFIINSLLSYVSEKAGFEASVGYNVQGPKLVITALYNNQPDIYELPRNMVDIKLTKKLGTHFMASLRIRDLLNTPVRRSYKYSAGWVYFDEYQYGTTYLFGLSYTL